MYQMLIALDRHLMGTTMDDLDTALILAILYEDIAFMTWSISLQLWVGLLKDFTTVPEK